MSVEIRVFKKDEGRWISLGEVDLSGYLPMAQGNSMQLSEDSNYNEFAYKNPDLHRFIDPHVPPLDGNPHEIARRYRLQVQIHDSYRTTDSIYHIDYQDIADKDAASRLLGYDLDDESYQKLRQLVEESEELEIP